MEEVRQRRPLPLLRAALFKVQLLAEHTRHLLAGRYRHRIPRNLDEMRHPSFDWASYFKESLRTWAWARRLSEADAAEEMYSILEEFLVDLPETARSRSELRDAGFYYSKMLAEAQSFLRRSKRHA